MKVIRNVILRPPGWHNCTWNRGPSAARDRRLGENSGSGKTVPLRGVSLRLRERAAPGAVALRPRSMNRLLRPPPNSAATCSDNVVGAPIPSTDGAFRRTGNREIELGY